MTSGGLRAQTHVRLVRRSRWRVALPASLVVGGLLAVLATDAYLSNERAAYLRLENRLVRLANQVNSIGEPGSYLVFDERGHLLSTAPLPIVETGEAFQILRAEGLGTVAALRMSFTSNGPHVVALTAQHELHTLGDVRRALVTLTLAAALVALVAGYALAGVALRPLDDAVRERREFVALVSHQLRTPLAIVRTSAELARDAKAVTPDEAMRTILKQADRMEGLTSRLSELARVESVPRSSAVSADVAAAVAAVVSSMRVLAEPTGVAVLADVPPSLHVRAEPAEITEMLGAVLDNAVKFSHPGGVVALRAWAEGGRAVIEVVDHGRGIAPGDLAYVAEPFFQGRQARGGYGLGLAIVRAIAERRGGRISVTSAPGQGTTVRVVLPLHRPAPAPFIAPLMGHRRATT
jgi:signal transduction histidine kinase